MNEIVRVTGLSKKFNGKSALSGLSFVMRQGDIFGVIGPDGAGKTTLLRILGGIMEPDSGEVYVAGYRLPKESERVKEECGYMPQKFSLYQDLTVNENIRFFADIFGIDAKTLNERIPPLLKMTRLGPFSDRLAGDLSGGMKQKLALMCTLIHRPKILILDEPTTGVDPVSRRELWEMLQQIRSEGVSIIVSTPYMDEAEWCGYVALLYEGKVLKEGGPAELKRSCKILVFEADCSSAVINEASAGVSGVRDIRAFGKMQRISVSNEETAEEIKRRIGDCGFKRVSVTIEDVFMENLAGENGNIG